VVPETPEVRLQTSEVDAFHFVPVEFFATHIQADKFVPYPRDMANSNKILKRLPLRSWVGLSEVHFPSVVLPPCPEESKKDLEMVLWGLTFQLTSEVLVEMMIGNMNLVPVRFPHADMNFYSSLWWKIFSQRSASFYFLLIQRFSPPLLSFLSQREGESFSRMWPLFSLPPSRCAPCFCFVLSRESLDFIDDLISLFV